MRKSKIIAVLMLCVFLLGGCVHSDVNTTDAKETSTMNNSETASSEAEFTIYKIGRDVFDGLLENNSFADTAKVSSKAFNYPQDGNRYVTYSTLAVEMTDKYISLFKGETLQDYLAENGVNENVRQFVAFEAPYVPLSIWIKTDDGTCFLTVEDEANCTLYSQAKYAEKYKTRQCALKINGEPAASGKTVKTYCDNAELPLLEILTSCGASINKKNESKIRISVNGETYVLDTAANSLCNKRNKKNNLLANCTGGGPYNMYYSNGEYYTDGETLQYVMNELNEKTEITYDTENQIVDIVTK